jgi:hypothetical protein
MLGREARVPNLAVKLPRRAKASRSLRPALARPHRPAGYETSGEDATSSRTKGRGPSGQHRRG